MLRILRQAKWKPSIRHFSTDKDVTYVDLNNVGQNPESEKAAASFFEYQTGRWLQNDRAERSKRTAKFDMKGLLEMLKRTVDVTQAGVAIETLEPYYEGKHNKLYKIVLKDRRAFMLRIPYALGSSEYRQARLLSEAATLDYLSSVAFEGNDKFRATAPLSYSASSSNELGAPYMLTSYVSGTKLASQWKPWSSNLDEKTPILTPMAQMAGAILKQKFPAYGSLYYKSDVPTGAETVPLNEKFVIGPSTEKRFWRGDMDNKELSRLRGPWKTWHDYLESISKVQLYYAEKNCGSDSANYRAASKFAQLVPSLFKPEEMIGEIASPRMFDPDFSPLNVISQDDGEKFWLLDVENTVIKPYVLHGVPWFVRNPGERVYNLSDVPNYESLPDQQKRVVQHFLSLTQTEFTYEKLLREEVKELIYAHHPNLKRREEVVSRSMQTDIDTGFYNDLNYSVFRLVQLWSVVSKGSECPVAFDEKEIEKLSNDIATWNESLMKNKFLESKGFVPADEFDTLLGTGSLKVIDDKIGNYELTEEFLNSQDPLKGI